jgi:hypothetical protein
VEIPGYEIIGELAVDQTARRYLARREADGTDVLITVVDAPEGDEGNALNHLASDVKIMATHPHPGVLGVLEGHWVGESFAVVTQRPAAPTLDELLVRRAEEFPFVRIATILRDINAALVWARERGVVHRALSQETVFVEAGSDRTMVSFGVKPIGLTDVPGEAEDNRAIAELAALMFTRGRKLVEGEATLAEMRPGLPSSLVTQTEALLGRAAEDAAVPTDMRSYIASIAMAEALKEGEEHLEANRNLIEQQQREHQEQLEKQRAEHEEVLAQEKAAHQKEREAHQRDRECYERDLEVLRVERERYKEEREQLRRERLDYDKEMSAILAQKARQRTRQGMELVARGWRRRPMWTTRLTRNWKTTAPIIAVAALVMVAAVALTQRENAPRGADRVVADSAAGVVTPAPALAAPAMIAGDSVAADTAARDTVGVPSGFLSGVMARAESLWARRPFRSEPPARVATPAPRPERSLDTIFTAPTLPLRDTIVRDTFPRRDTTARRDSIIRRDTIVRRDTLAPPDSVPRRDTLPARPDSLSRQ